MPDLLLPDLGTPSSTRRPRRVVVSTLRSAASSGALRGRRAEGLAVGGAAIQRQSSGVDFRLLTENTLENREQQMREALRLPPTAVRPLSVQVVNRAEASPAAGRPLGIRGLVARGSGVVAARQSRQSEVQLPDVAPQLQASNSRAELRQRLEEQELALQRQLQEQAELQRQLQQHLEQEQQLQRELREELEREIQGFSQLERLVSTNLQGQTSAEEATEVNERAETAAEQTAASEAGRNSDMIEVPGIGPLPRQQLANLEALLNGQDVATGAENLPDLGALSSSQLQSLEAELSRGLLSRSDSERLATGANESRPPQEPAGDPEVLNHQAERPQGMMAMMPPLPRQAANSTSAWRLKEAALEALIVKVVPRLECSICCEMLESMEVVALPCETRGCGSYFHAECIRPWLERNPSCPLCRDALPQLVRPTTPLPQGTGNPLLDLWFLAMAMQRQERENMSRRQSNGPSLADLQGVVFTASALVDLLSAHLGFDEDRGLGDLEDGPNLDMALQAMLVNNLNGSRDENPQANPRESSEAPAPDGHRERPVNSFQEEILRSAAAMELQGDPRSPHR
mmetsp:Transcript_16487/g.27245  ORF Transcript_16487/g.27245 Transcript_16487/m.27245 type:complete len:573 (+) Transcript_16487:35-1753(+)